MSTKTNKLVWLTVLLVAGYVTLQLVADVCAVKMVSLFGVVLPGGSLVYAVTFTWRDLVHKKLGRAWARACIFLAAAMNVFMGLAFVWLIKMPYPPFFGAQAAVEVVLMQVPRIVIASIIAELVSELVDTELYQLVWRALGSRFQWLRVVASNGISVPVDSALFAGLAFGGVFPTAALVSMIWGQCVWKWLVGAVSTPMIYAISEGPGVTIVEA